MFVCLCDWVTVSKQTVHTQSLSCFSQMQKFTTKVLIVSSTTKAALTSCHSIYHKERIFTDLLQNKLLFKGWNDSYHKCYT